jgi:hypothetical protein
MWPSGWRIRYSDSAQAGRSRVRTKWGVEFYVPVQTDPGTHQLLRNEYWSSFLGVKWPECGVNHAPILAPRVGRATPLPILCLHGMVWDELYFYLLNV